MIAPPTATGLSRRTFAVADLGDLSGGTPVARPLLHLARMLHTASMRAGRSDDGHRPRCWSVPSSLSPAARARSNGAKGRSARRAGVSTGTGPASATGRGRHHRASAACRWQRAGRGSAEAERAGPAAAPPARRMAAGGSQETLRSGTHVRRQLDRLARLLRPDHMRRPGDDLAANAVRRPDVRRREVPDARGSARQGLLDRDRLRPARRRCASETTSS